MPQIVLGICLLIYGVSTLYFSLKIINNIQYELNINVLIVKGFLAAKPYPIPSILKLVSLFIWCTSGTICLLLSVITFLAAFNLLP